MLLFAVASMCLRRLLGLGGSTKSDQPIFVAKGQGGAAPAQGQGAAPAQGQGGAPVEPAEKRYFPSLGTGCINDLGADFDDPDACTLTSNVMNMCPRP